MAKGPRYNSNSPIIPLDIHDMYIGEQFRPITQNMVPGIYDYYMISNFGRVYNKFSGKFIKPTVGDFGYESVCVATCYGYPPVLIHRMVMLAFYPIENADQMQVNHKDGNKTNNSILNLEWCTPKENIAHSFKTGLHEYTYSAKITEEQIIQICEMLKTGQYTAKEIADRFGIGTTAISNIKRKVTWPHITKDYDFDYREFRLFTEEMIRNICKYFEDNPIGNLNQLQYCRNALQYYGYDSSDKMAKAATNILKRINYTSISCNYNF